MRYRVTLILMLFCLILSLPVLESSALTPMSQDGNTLEDTTQNSRKKADKTSFTQNRQSRNPSFSADKKTSAPPEKQPVPEKTEENSSEWIPEVGKLYLEEKLSSKDLIHLFVTLERHLGIQKNGMLGLGKAREAQAALYRYSEDPDKPFSNIYFDDKLNLTGYNFIYFEMCVLNKGRYGDRFKTYFERGYYPNSSLFIREEYYYKSLYYYLYVAQDGLINHITQAINQLNQNPNSPPSFTEDDILTLDTVVKVCSELDELRNKGGNGLDSPYEKIFSPEEQAWLNDSITYFTSIDTHIALFSYPWFKAHIPLSISAQVIANDIRETWVNQTISHRALLPLMLFTNQGDDIQFSVEKLFGDTLNKMKLDNREVDVMVMAALKTWLRKQVDHGIKVEDRVKYKDILDELDVCPSGWIFYNLYSCRKPLEEMKEYARKWDSFTAEKKKEIFNSKIVYLYADALDKINIVFSDLEKLFGKVQVFGGEQKATSINYIFHRYRGEIGYYYEYLQFGLYDDKALSSMRFPLANSRKNCLFDFKAAFVKADDKPINHKNLLAAYDLLFKELASQGKISEIIKFENELEAFINQNRNGLGSLVSHTEDDRYDIYRIIANTYLPNKQLQVRALQVAGRSYLLARKYYVDAAENAGYLQGNIVGALNNNCSEIDDFERQFEFYQDIALKLGKKIWLLLPNEDIQLYNRLQNLRNPEGFLL